MTLGGRYGEAHAVDRVADVWTTGTSATSTRHRRPAGVLHRAQKTLIDATPVPVLAIPAVCSSSTTYTAVARQAFDDENSISIGQVLSAQKEQRPRWKRVLDAQDGDHGHDRSASSSCRSISRRPRRSATRKLVEAIRMRRSATASTARLDERRDEGQGALKKLAAVTIKVGYPDKWKDYSRTRRRSATRTAENLMNAAPWRFNDRCRSSASRWTAPNGT